MRRATSVCSWLGYPVGVCPEYFCPKRWADGSHRGVVDSLRTLWFVVIHAQFRIRVGIESGAMRLEGVVYHYKGRVAGAHEVLASAHA